MRKLIHFGLFFTFQASCFFAKAETSNLCQVEVGIDLRSSRVLQRIESSALYQQVFKNMRNVADSYQSVNLVCLTAEGALYHIKVRAPYYRNDDTCVTKYNECTANFQLDNSADQILSGPTDVVCRALEWHDPHCHGEY